MPTDRLFRFSISGMMFFISILFFLYLFGWKSIDQIFDFLTNKTFVPLIAIFISTPIVGIIISTVTVMILQICKGYELFYYVPTDHKIISSLCNNIELKAAMLIPKSENCNYRYTIKRFYPHYQAKVKICITDEALSFLERRWSTYWTHTNNRFAIFYALIFVFPYKDFFNGWLKFNPDVSQFAYVGLGFILIYFIVSLIQGRQSRKDAHEFEHILLAKAIKSELNSNEPKYKSLRTR